MSDTNERCQTKLFFNVCHYPVMKVHSGKGEQVLKFQYACKVVTVCEEIAIGRNHHIDEERLTQAALDSIT